jgi:basic amino acid/polyamine antiporter, APA family
VALLAQLGLGLFALWTSTFEGILTYVGFTLGICTLATIVGLCRIRIKEGPALRVPGWPWVPGLFLAFVAGSTLFAVVQRPLEGLVGFCTLTVLGGGYLLRQYLVARRQPPSADGSPPQA